MFLFRWASQEIKYVDFRLPREINQTFALNFRFIAKVNPREPKRLVYWNIDMDREMNILTRLV